MPIATLAGKDNFGGYGLDNFVAYAAIGTGTPTFSSASTTLENEVQITNSNGGFGDVIDYTIVNRAGVDYLRRTRTFYRVFDLSVARNITEYGLTPESSGGTMSVVGRTRVDPNDEGSGLFTISADAGDQIQLILQEIEDLPWQLQAGTIVIQGLAGNDGNGTFGVQKTFFNEQQGGAFANWNPTASFAFTLINAEGSTMTATNQYPTSHPSKPIGSLNSYANGSYFRERQVTFGTSENNGVIYGFCFTNRPQGTPAGGFKAHFTNPATFTKTSAQTLLVTFRSSWDWL